MVINLLGCGGGAFGGDDGFDAGDIAADIAEHVWALELPRLLLDSQVEDLVAELAFARLEFFDGQFFDFRNFHVFR